MRSNRWTRAGRRIGIAVPAVAILIPLALGSAAQASPGTVAQTQHYSHDDEWQTPIGQPTSVSASCGTAPGTFGAAVLDDYVHIVGDGNGISHFNINGAGDFWSTSTFTGNVTLDLWNPANIDVTVDGSGNITETVVHPGATPDYTATGKLTEWFGFSDNLQNAVGNGTFNFHGTVPDVGSIALHGNFHLQWPKGTDPDTNPPTRYRQDAFVTCG